MANLGSVSALTTYVNTNVEDNTSNNVTPADVRQSIINTIDTLVGVGVQPKVYKAILNQTGTDAPVATVLVNTLGGTVVWTRSNPGDYAGTLAAAFPVAKTLVWSTSQEDPSSGASVYCSPFGDTNTITLLTFSSDALADGAITPLSVIIEVYP